jgi:hypothetical protein
MIHDTALADLTRQDPKSALIDEAIYQYATITDPASRTRRVASIIAPVFDQIRVHPAQVFNGRRMAPYVDFRLEKIATATDAAASDEGFSAFLYTASNWYIDRQTHPGGLTIPCAALVRSPGLLGAFGERFAPGSDCDATLPPTPRLDALVDAAFKAQPPCGGTIVKDTGAEFAQLMLRVRLNLRDTRFGPQKSASPGAEMDKDQQKFRNSHAQAVHNAIDEMTNYYVANFRMQPTAARAQAKQVVDLAVSGPFNLCE